MAHRMCVACRIRSQTEGKSDDCVDELCPDCGSLMEPVAELSSIVGFRSNGGSGTAADATGSGQPDQIAGQLEGIFSRRGAFQDLARFDAEFDEYGEGDGLRAGAVSLPWPDTTK
jgi:hypothetical protein